MDIGRNIDCPNLPDGCLHIGDRILVDAVIGPQRKFGRILLPPLFRRYEFRLVRPELVGTDAMPVPPLHGATATGPLVVLPGPLIIDPGHVVEHALADFGHLGRFFPGLDFLIHVFFPKQVVDDRRQTEAGAGPLLTLIQDQFVDSGIVSQMRFYEFLGWVLLWETDKRWIVDPVTVVNAVGAGIECAIINSVGRHGGPPLISFVLLIYFNTLPYIKTKSSRRSKPVPGRKRSNQPTYKGKNC